MNHYDIHCTPVLCAHSFNRNLQKSKTMTNLIARKNLFRLSEGCFSLAQKLERHGFMTLSKMFVIAWERCLDLRDKLR